MQRYEPIRPRVHLPDYGYGSRGHFRLLQCRIRGSKQRIREAEKNLAAPNRQLTGISLSAHELAQLQKSHAEMDLKKARSEALQATKMNKADAEQVQLKTNPEWLIGG